LNHHFVVFEFPADLSFSKKYFTDFLFLRLFT